MSSPIPKMSSIEIGKKVLVTTDNWVFGPDGRSYRAVYGTVRGVFTDEQTLGIRTNARSTNWYVEIGCMVVAGCQIHYAIQTDKAQLGEIDDFREEVGVVHAFRRPSYIFDADSPKS